MKRKFLFILLAMLMVLILMGGVTANDLNQTDNVMSVNDDSSSISINDVEATSNTINISSANDVLQATADREILGGSFSDLSTEISGKSGDIVLTEDYSGGGSGEGIYVSNSITSITGNKGGAPVTLDASNNGRIFNVVGNSKITFSNIKFVNGYSQYNPGGALYVGGNSEVIFKDCTFEYNYATASGALFIDQSSKATFNNCVFDHNTANGANYLDGSGGALLLKGSDNYIINCTFSNNKVNTYSGGALVINNARNHVLDTIFVNNSAVEKGGAVWAGQQFHMENNKYINNSANYAGAIATEYINLIFANSTFVANKAITEGGAICVKYNEMKVINCRFINNSAGTYGGALTFAEQIRQTIDDSYFEGNTAQYGGAIFCFNGGDYYNPNSIRNCEFVKNSAVNGGAVYFNKTGGTNVNGSTFIENVASHNGGALYIIAQDGKHYVDYDGFKRNGVKTNYGDEFSWSVKDDKLTYEYILKCKFVDNVDYQFAVGTTISGLTAVITVLVPDADTLTDDAVIKLNVTYENGTVSQYTFTKDDVENGVINLQLSKLAMEEYKLSASFDDGENYFYKIIEDSFIIVEPKGDFTILQELIDGTIENYTGTGIPTLFLSRNYIYTPDLDHGQINITNAIIIYGNGFYVDALNYCRIFKITANQVSIRDIELVNGNATGEMSDDNPRGGAIYWTGESGLIYRTTFSNNTALDGGAVFVNARAGQGKITESTFYNNTAKNHGGAIDWNASGGYLEDSILYDNIADYGGAVFVGASGVSSHIIGTTFKSNNATYRGGAVDWYSSSGDLEDSYFENNHADYGGAVFVGHETDGGKIINTVFTKNSADVRGGAIDWNASRGSVTYSTFNYNEAPYGGAIFVGSYSEGGYIFQSTFTGNKAEFNGGAIDWNASVGNVNQSTFADNYAYNGGAVFVGANGAAGHIIQSVFRNNTAENRGGAVDWYASSGEIFNSTFNINHAYNGGAVFVGTSTDGGKIISSTFNGNTAVNKGGAIDWNATSGILNESIFIRNSADYGGAVFVGSSTSGGMIYKSTFEYNTANYNGGAVDWNASRGHLNESTFSYNKAAYGGAVFVGASTSGGAIYKSTFTSNVATYNGGAIDWNASTGNLDSSEFYNNKAYNGGAVFVGASGAAGRIYKSIFEGNNATNRGGAVDWYASSGDLEESTFVSNYAYDGGAVFVGRTTDGGKIYKSTFTSNIAEHNGGAVDWNASRGNLSYSEFNYNEAAYGGAVFVGASTTNGIINYSNFTGNKAKYNGGAVDWNASSGNLQNSRFTFNSATNGGAVFVGASGDAGHIFNSYFAENTASQRGGAVDWYAASGDLENSIFLSNTADYGGAVFVGHQTNGGSVINSTFTSNTAKYNGGAIDWNATSGDVEGSRFTNNHADYGGAVFVGHQTSNGKIIDSNFTSNTATHNGGAIDWNATSGDVENSIFRDNLADYGGAIFVGHYTANGKVINSKFYSNGATYNGGAVDWNASSGHVEDSLFERNYADNGGAIFVGTATENSKIINSTFNYNTATTKGGAVDWNASRGTVEDSRFTRNEAVYGGAIFVGKSSSNGYITRSNFTLNTATRGGAIDWNASSGNVSDSRFERNNAVDGGAIFVGHDADKGTIYNSYFHMNTADEKGGAILFNNISDAKVSCSNFTSNSANDGGAIYVIACDKLLVNESDFTKNTAVNSSGAIHWEGDDGDLFNSTFTDNEAQTYDGGAIGWYGGDGYLFNITFTNNKAGRHGGAVYWDESKKGIVNQSTFKENVATGNGGALYWNADAHDIIENSTFYHNQAMDGGAIIWMDSDGGKIRNNTFTYNIALNNGGAIMGDNGSNIIIKDNAFNNNRATGYTNFDNIDYGQGGAIYWNDGDNLTITDAKFTRNSAHVAGGAVVICSSDEAHLYDLNFTDSNSENIAGAIYVKNSDDIDIHNVSFTKSSANNNGGAAYFEYSTGNVENVTFNQSSSNWGTAGAIYVLSSMDFNNISITDSSSLNSLGQSVVFAWGESTLSNSSTNDENAIVILIGASVTLTKVNNTDCDDALYSVLNGGTLSLEKNEFDNVIINGGLIITQTYIIILDNKTVIVDEGETVMLNSTIYDDNENIIVVSNDVDGMHFDFFQFIEMVDNETFTTNYNGKHNFAEYKNVKIGEHTISTAWYNSFNARAGGLINNTLKNGTVIAKAKSSVNITVDQTNEGEIVTIKAQVKPLDATGNVTFKINDKIYTPIKINETTGIATLILNNVTAGTYTVTATYNGDDIHFNATNSTLFVVKLREISLRIDIANIYFGSNATAIITTNATNGTGVVIINGRQYQIKIVNGVAKINATGLKPGNYSAMVLYNANEYYNYKFNSTNFTVYKLNTTIEATPTTPITYDENEIITVKVGENATGFVKITIGEEKYLKQLTDGTATFNITGLPVGEYENIQVEYLGDDIYNSNSTTVKFSVTGKDAIIKNNTNITIDVEKIIEIDDTLTFTVTTNSTANLTVKVNGIIIKPDNTGKYTYTNTGNIGVYTITAETIENSNYYANSTSATFTVVKHNSTVGIKVNSTYYVDEEIEITITNNTNVTVTVNGKEYKLTGGQIKIPAGELSAGEYIINALIKENDKYSGNETNKTFKVIKYNAVIKEITIPSGNITVGQNVTLTVTMGNVTTGTILMEINGQNYSVNINQSIAKLNVTLPAGEYKVTAYYLGDEKYNATKLSNETINVVDKNITGINITHIKVVEIDGRLTVKVESNSTAPVTVTVNGKKVTLTNNEFVANTTVAGVYTITASVDENEYWTAATNTTTYTVVKHNSTAGITVNPVYFIGEDIVIGIVNNTNATVTINGKPYTIDNGQIKFNAGDLAAGEYIVSVTVPENEKYYGNSTNKTFKVVKYNAVIDSIIIPSADVIVGHNATITVNFNNITSGSVVIEVNGQNYTVDIKNNVSVLNITLPVGTYTAKAYFLGDDKHNATDKVSESFEVVNKNISGINITHIKVVEIDGKLVVKVESNSSAPVAVTVNGETVTLNSTKEFVADTGVAGVYTIVASVDENENWTAASNTTNFTVIKHNSTALIEVDPIHFVNDTFEIKVTSNTTVNVTINGKTYNVNDGKVQINTKELAAGEYTVVATVYENAKYYGNITNKTFKVVKYNAVIKEITVPQYPVTIGQNATIIVEMDNVTSGKLIIEVNGANYTVDIKDKFAKFNITLPAGEYDAKVYYLGDYKYNATNLASAKFQFGDKNISKVIITVDKTIEIENTLVFTVETNNNHNLIVKIGDQVITNGTDGKYRYAANTAGEFTITATVDENDFWSSASNSSIFTVYKHSSDFTIIAPENNVTVGQNATITVNMNRTESGNVIIEVNNANYTVNIKDGKAVFNITLPAGTYSARVFYIGDAKYNASNKTSESFNIVNKNVSGINIISVDVIVIDDTLTFTVKTNSTSSLVVKVNDEVVTINDGKYVYTPETVGVYTITASVVENDFWTAASESKTFTVIKHNSTALIEVTPVHFVNDTFEIKVFSNTTVNVTINGKSYKLNDDGTVNINTKELVAGEYIVTATVYENDKYNGNFTNKSFKVVKYNAVIDSIIIPTDDVIVDHNATITVNFNNITKGTVIIEVNKHNYTVDISDKVAELNVTLPAGEYKVTAYFLGDDKHNATKLSNQTIKVVDKKVAGINITHIKVVEIDGKLVVKVESNSSAPVIVTVNGKNVTLNTTKEFSAPVDVAGVYTIVASVEENENWTAATNTTTYTVIKHNSTVTITVPAINYVEDSFEITITNNTVANVTINGKVYDVVNGKVDVDTEDLAAGEYTVVATVYESDKYYGNITNKTFKVVKYNAEIKEITVPQHHVTIGQNATIIVEMGNVTTGKVIIEVNGANYTADIKDKFAKLNITLPAGEYDAKVYFLGDYKYNATNLTSTKFQFGDKNISKIIITVDKTIEIDNTLVFTVETNNNNNLIVKIGDQVITNDTDGKYRYDANTAGEFTITATVDENDFWSSAANSSSFTVYKHSSDFTITVPENNVTVGQNATITVTMDAYESGNVIIEVNRVNYTVNIKDGKAVFNITLPTGSYTARIFYNGDDKYNASNKTSESFNIVNKNVSGINITAIDVIVIDNTLTFTVKTNSTAPLTVKVNGETVTVTDGKYTYTPETAGIYTITADVDENDFWTGVSESKTFTVIKHNSTALIKVTPVHYVDEVFEINVTSNTTVNVTINGKTYNVKDGKVEINTADLTAGEYTVIATVYENPKYNANVTKAVFTINKIKPDVTVKADSISVGDVAVINVTAPSDINGIVIVSVNGTNYTMIVSDGKGSLSVDKLGNGTYNINVTYLENSKYLRAINSTTLTVSKLTPEITVKSGDITLGDNLIVKVTLPDDVTGTVTVKVNDTTVTVGVTGGENTILIPGLTVGKYNVNVTYNGNDKYLPVNKSTAITVKPVNTTKDDIKVDDLGNGTIIVTVPENATGNVTVKVGNETYNATIGENGTAIINLTNVTPGTYNVTVIYSGDENNTNVTFNTTINVAKYLTPISIDVNSTVVGNITKVVVTVPSGVKNNVTVEIDGKTYTNVTDNGIATFNIAGLTAGNKTITAVYAGDSDYVFNSTTATFTVSKNRSNVTVKVDSISVGDVAVINITAPIDFNGTAVVSVNGTNYSVIINEGKGSVEVAKLGNGTYNISVKLLENDKYLSNTNETKLTVSKVSDTTIDSSVKNATVGEPVEVTVILPDDATGTVTVKINNTTVTVGITGGENTILVPGVPVGTHDVEITYNGDDKYESASTADEVTVKPLNTTKVGIGVDDLGNGTIIVTVPENATGNVTVKVGNETYNATIGENGTAIINLTNVTPGTYNVTVIYSGDENNTGAVLNTTIHVNKYETPISIDVNSTVVGNITKVVVTVPSGVKTNVTVEIDGKSYTNVTDNGIVTFHISGLTAGNKTITAVYAGDSDYVFNSTTATFIVFKNNSTVSVETEAINVGETAVINVTAPADFNGTAVVSVNGTNYSVVISNGKGSVEVTKLGNGTYDINVKLLENDKYLSNNTSTKLTVSKVSDATIDSSVKNATVGEPVEVTVILPDDATGTVTVKINNTTVTVGITGGENTVLVPGVPVGTHEVEIIYNGDDKYAPATTTNSVTVKPLNTTDDNVKIIDSGNGTVIITLPGNATGNITVKEGNNTYNVTVINGTAIVNMTNTTPGEHNITIIYSGDENHTDITVNRTVTVQKYDTPITINVSDINVGDTAVITVNVPEGVKGNVTIEINAMKFTQKVIDGKAVFSVDNLAWGNKTVTATYAGDDYYVFNSTTNQFKVDKVQNVNITVKADPITVGQTATIDMTGPEDINGTVIVDVNGTKYYVELTDGKGKLEVNNLNEGNYPIKATYMENNKYISADASTNLEVSKLPNTEISATAQNTTVGKPVEVTVTVPEDATGNVTVTISNITKTVPVTGGENIILIPDIPVGEYDIKVTYNGDDKYAPNTTSTKVTVSPAKTTPEDIKVTDSGNGTITITVPENATGNITVTVDGKNYTADIVNGTATIKIDNVTPGVHDITVIYSGDENNSGVTFNSTVTIPKWDSTMDVKVTTNNDEVTVDVTLDPEATGVVLIDIDGVGYYANVTDGKAKLTVKGLKPGNYNAVVTYPGDDKFNNATQTESFNITQVIPTPRIGTYIEVDSKFTRVANDFYDAGEKGAMFYGVLKDTNGNVLPNKIVQITVNGVIYNVTTDSQGRAGLQINLVSANVYTYALFFQGDDTYDASPLASSRLTVTKKPTIILIKHKTFKASVKKSKKITVTLKTSKNPYDGKSYLGKGKYIKLTINGKTYTAKTNAKNKATFTIKINKKGKYVGKLRFKGTKTYAESSRTIKVTVK